MTRDRPRARWWWLADLGDWREGLIRQVWLPLVVLVHCSAVVAAWQLKQRSQL